MSAVSKAAVAGQEVRAVWGLPQVLHDVRAGAGLLRSTACFATGVLGGLVNGSLLLEGSLLVEQSLLNDTLLPAQLYISSPAPAPHAPGWVPVRHADNSRQGSYRLILILRYETRVNRKAFSSSRVTQRW